MDDGDGAKASLPAAQAASRTTARIRAARRLSANAAALSPLSLALTVRLPLPGTNATGRLQKNDTQAQVRAIVQCADACVGVQRSKRRRRGMTTHPPATYIAPWPCGPFIALCRRVKSYKTKKHAPVCGQKEPVKRSKLKNETILTLFNLRKLAKGSLHRRWSHSLWDA
jgi:hypothetical protein